MFKVWLCLFLCWFLGYKEQFFSFDSSFLFSSKYNITIMKKVCLYINIIWCTNFFILVDLLHKVFFLVFYFFFSFKVKRYFLIFSKCICDFQLYCSVASAECWNFKLRAFDNFYFVLCVNGTAYTFGNFLSVVWRCCCCCWKRGNRAGWRPTTLGIRVLFKVYACHWKIRNKNLKHNQNISTNTWAFANK